MADGGRKDDLESLYDKCKAERLEEQRIAEEERNRLDAINRLFLEFEGKTETNSSLTKEDSSTENRNSVIGKIKTNGSLSKSVSSSSADGLSSSSSGFVNGSISPISNQTKSSLDNSSTSSAQFSSGASYNTRFLESNTAANNYNRANEHLTGFSSIGNGDSFGFSSYRRNGVETNSIDDTLALANEIEACYGLNEGHWLNGSGTGSTYRDESEASGASYYLCDGPGDTINRNGDFCGVDGGRHESWDMELSSLKEHQCDVIQSIAETKRKIAGLEAQQRETLQGLEVEKALLDGEQELQVEQLQLAQEKITRLEEQESKLLDGSVKKCSEKLETIRKEKTKLKEMERRLVKLTQSHSGDVASLSTESANIADEREAIETQKALVDNVEFQQLEDESRYEEEREGIQQQIKQEREDALELCKQHQEKIDKIAFQQSSILRLVDSDVFELEKDRQRLLDQYKMENSLLSKINEKIAQILQSQNSLEMRSKSVEELGSLDLLESINKVEESSRKLSQVDSMLDRRQQFFNGYRRNDFGGDSILHKSDSRRSLPPPSPRGGSFRRTRGGAHAPNIIRGRRERSEGPFDGWSHFTSDESDGEEEFVEGGGSSASGGSEQNTRIVCHEEELERLYDMEVLLVLAKAERLRLVSQQRSRQLAIEGIGNGVVQNEAGRRIVELDTSDDLTDERLSYENSVENGDTERVSSVSRGGNDTARQDSADSIKKRRPDPNKLQSRPLTRYLPVKSRNLDLLQFITSAGHNVDQCCHVIVTSTCCRGFLVKMGGRIRSWKKRWFVFDRLRCSLSYYSDSRERSKARGVIYFQAIKDVFVDHVCRVKSPTPQLTFCVKTLDRVYYLVAPSPDSMRIWIDAIFTGAEGFQHYT